MDRTHAEGGGRPRQTPPGKAPLPDEQTGRGRPPAARRENAAPRTRGTSRAGRRRHGSLPRIVRRQSSIDGYGVFAAEPIPKNTRVIDYAGELVRNGAECEAREERYREEGHLWVFRVNRAWSRDANVGGNIARFINHSCTPNCWFEVVDKTIWIRAGRNIRRGEELTYDYRVIGERTLPCRCRPGCPNRL